MKSSLVSILATLAFLCLTGCALTKVVTVPVKAAASVIGGTADVID